MRQGSQAGKQHRQSSALQARAIPGLPRLGSFAACLSPVVIVACWLRLVALLPRFTMKLNCNIWRRLGFGAAALLSVVNSGCSGKEDAAPETPVLSEPVSGVQRVLLSESPLFLLAGDGEGHTVGFLAAKDQFGNPYAVTGAAFFDGADFFSVEVDPLGRPTRFLTRDVLVELSSYTEMSAMMTITRGAKAETRELSFAPEELEELLSRPPSLDLVDKAKQSSSELQALQFAHWLLEVYGCHHSLGTSNVPRTLRDVLVQSLLTTSECIGAVAVPATLVHTLETLAASTATVGCVSDVARVGLGLASGIGVGVGLGALLKGFVDCPVAVHEIMSLYEKHAHEARLQAGFDLRFEGKLKVNERCLLSVYLEPREHDELLRNVRVDLGSIGGPDGSQLFGTGRLEWQGMVQPQEAGVQYVPLTVDMHYINTFPVPVQSTDELDVSISPSQFIVPAGSSVTLTAAVTGGSPPYTYEWTLKRDKGSVEELPGSRNLSTISDTPSMGTEYELAVLDSRRLPHPVAAGPVRIEVCGDHSCGSAEDSANCSEDCHDQDPGDELDPDPDPESDPEASPDPEPEPGESAPAEAQPIEGGSCDAACNYRSARLGCADFAGACWAFCEALHSVAESEGVCSEIALTLEDCHYSRAALELGCTSTSSDADETVCAAPATALAACRKLRDASR